MQCKSEVIKAPTKWIHVNIINKKYQYINQIHILHQVYMSFFPIHNCIISHHIFRQITKKYKTQAINSNNTQQRTETQEEL